MHSALMLLVQLSNISREVECLFFCTGLFYFVSNWSSLLSCFVPVAPCLLSPVVPNHWRRHTRAQQLKTRCSHSTCKKGSCALTLCFAAISWPCSLVTFLRWTRSTLFATNTIGKASLHTRQEQVMNLTAAGRERLLTRLHTFCGSYLTSEP